MYWKLLVCADQDGVDNDIGTDEEIHQGFRNAEEHC